MAENTFLGLQPYTEDDAYRFKGRTEESQELFRLIVRNDFTVCYAESGEGKTSLLNAGVFPLLRENMYFPIAITFTSDDYQVTPDNFSTIIDRCIKDSITEYNEKNKGVNVEYRLCSTDFQGLDCQTKLQQELSKYSWWKLRNYKPQAMGLTFTPVFVFDQFEEVFDMPGSIVWTKKFFDWLEDVSSDSCPDEIAKKIRAIIGTNAAFPAIKEEKDFKAVFSLRKEFIGELDYWGMQKCFIPSLKDNRYCLKALTYEGAKKVMTQQERFDEEKVEQILNYFVKKYSREPIRTIEEDLPVIPALLLSVVGNSWEKDSQYFIEEDDDSIENSLSNILEQFYDSTIERIVHDFVSEWNEKSKDIAQSSPWYGVQGLGEGFYRREIEEILFLLVDRNGKRERTKTTSSRFSKIGFDEKYKNSLCDNRIIKVTKVDGEDYVEIVHDSLCPIVAKKKEEKYAAEIKAREEFKIREREKEMERLLHRRRFARLFTCFLLLIAGAFVTLFYFARTRTVINEWANPFVRYAAFNDDKVWYPEDVQKAGEVIGSKILFWNNDSLPISIANEGRLEKLIIDIPHPQFASLSNCPNLKEIIFTNKVVDVTANCWCGGLSPNLTIGIGDNLENITGQLLSDQDKIKFVLSPSNNHFQLGSAYYREGLGIDSVSVFWRKDTKEILFFEGYSHNSLISFRHKKLRFPQELRGLNSYYHEIEDTTEIILSGQSAYAGLPITTTHIPDVDSIVGDYAFMGCEQLVSANLNNVKHISSMAFADCHKLRTIDLSKVNNLSHLVFLNCYELTSVKLPNDSITIGGSAFDGCGNLKEVIFPKILRLDTEATFRRCSNLEKVILPDSIIPDNFYASCFPNLPKMFGLCPRLKNISFSKNSHFNWREDSVLYYDDYPAILNLCSNPNWAAKDSSFYFEGGILYMKGDSEIYNDSQFIRNPRVFIDVYYGGNEPVGVHDPTAFSSRSYFFFESRIGSIWPYLLFTPSNDSTIIADQFPLHGGTFTFINAKADIREIHLPYAEPKYVGLDFTQTTLQQKNITLYVPYSQGRNYQNDPRFKDYKDIVEEKWETTAWQIFKDDIRLFFVKDVGESHTPALYIPLLFTILFTLFLFTVIYKFRFKTILNSVAFIIIGLCSWYEIYWMSFHYLVNNIEINSVYGCIIISCLFSLCCTGCILLYCFPRTSIKTKNDMTHDTRDRYLSQDGD